MKKYQLITFFIACLLILGEVSITNAQSPLEQNQAFIIGLSDIQKKGRDPNKAELLELIKKYPEGAKMLANSIGLTVEEYLIVALSETDKAAAEELRENPVLLSKLLTSSSEEEQPKTYKFKNHRELLKKMKEDGTDDEKMIVGMMMTLLDKDGMMPDSQPEMQQAIKVYEVIYGEVGGIENFKPEDVILLEEKLAGSNVLKNVNGKLPSEQMLEYLEEVITKGNTSKNWQQITLQNLEDTKDAAISKLVREGEKEAKQVGRLYNLSLALKNRVIESRLRQKLAVQKSDNKTLKKQFLAWQEEDLAYDALSRFQLKELKEIGIDTDSLRNWQFSINKKEESILEQLQLPESKAFNWKGVQEDLKPQEAAVEIIRFKYFNPKATEEIRYVALILKAGVPEPKLVVLKNGTSLESTVLNQYFNEMTEGIDKTVYENLWAPIDAHLKDTEVVYLSADGIYHQINLAILSTDKAREQLVFDRYDIRMVNSTRFLDQPVLTKEVSQKEALLIGNPDFDHIFPYKDSGSKIIDKKWQTLPGAEVEVVSIENLLSKNQYLTTALINDAATEQAIITQSPALLHIASHAFFQEANKQNIDALDIFQGFYNMDLNEISPTGFLGFHFLGLNPMLRGGIALTAANQAYTNVKKPLQSDGYLMAYEIQHLDLTNTELVVLSACSGAKGTISRGQGVFGLQQAFFTAGTKSIIMSLWEVQDHIAKDFSISFYDNWLNKKLSKRDAFRATQTILREKYEDAPYLWGGFIMVEF